MMNYKHAFKMIKEDYKRYSCHFGGGHFFKITKGTYP